MVACYLSYFGVAFFAMRWWRLSERRRSHRFSLMAVLAAGCWAFLLMMVLMPGRELPPALASLVLSAVVIQLVSPWQAPPPRPKRRLRLQGA